MQPAPQQAAAHGCHTAVHHGEQGVAVAAREIDVDFQVAPGGRVHDDALGPALMADTANMGQVAALGILTYCSRQPAAPMARQVVAAEALEVVVWNWLLRARARCP